MNPLMQAMQVANNPMNKMSQAANLMKMLRSGNPSRIAQQLMKNNPQFRQFIEDNKEKTPQQVAQEHGINLSQLNKMM